MKKYDVLIHECGIPLDLAKIQELVGEARVHLINQAYEAHKRITPEILFGRFGVPKVFVRGHAPQRGYHPGTAVVCDIEWVRNNHPGVYLIAFKTDLEKGKIKGAHAFVHRSGDLEEELARGISAGLEKK